MTTEVIIDINNLYAYDAIMRTTVTIEDNLAAQIEDVRRRDGLSFKQALNHILRLGLAAKSTPPARREFTTQTASLGLKAGIDPTQLNKLLDELDSDDFVNEK